MNPIESKFRKLRTDNSRVFSSRSLRLGAEPPLVHPSYNHTPDERAFLAVAGVLCLFGMVILMILAWCGVIP